MPRLSDEEVLDLIADRSYQKGRRRFILRSVLLYGIVWSAVFDAFEWYSHSYHLHGIWLISYLIISLGVGCAVGYGIARSLWRSIERRALRSSRQ
jgi:hypothetical protein